MGFSLYNIFKVQLYLITFDISSSKLTCCNTHFQAGLLVANGVAVLHPQRFLAKCTDSLNLFSLNVNYHSHIVFNVDGFDQPDLSGEANGLKNQTIGLLQAVSYLKG